MKIKKIQRAMKGGDQMQESTERSKSKKSVDETRAGARSGVQRHGSFHKTLPVSNQYMLEVGGEEVTKACQEPITNTVEKNVRENT